LPIVLHCYSATNPQKCAVIVCYLLHREVMVLLSSWTNFLVTDSSISCFTCAHHSNKHVCQTFANRWPSSIIACEAKKLQNICANCAHTQPFWHFTC